MSAHTSAGRSAVEAVSALTIVVSVFCSPVADACGISLLETTWLDRPEVFFSMSLIGIGGTWNIWQIHANNCSSTALNGATKKGTKLEIECAVFFLTYGLEKQPSIIVSQFLFRTYHGLNTKFSCSFTSAAHTTYRCHFLMLEMLRDQTAKSIKKKHKALLLVCKNTERLQNTKIERPKTALLHISLRPNSTWPSQSGRVFTFPAGAYHSPVNRKSIAAALLVLFNNIKEQDSEHPNQDTTSFKTTLKD